VLCDSILQELMDAEKEERRRKRAEGKVKGGGEFEEEDKLKLEELEAPHGIFENGDGLLAEKR
jgi:hypothetical protein